MRESPRLFVVAVACMALARAQEPDRPPLLGNLMQNIEYATLLQRSALTPDQLEVLAEAQTKWLTAAAVPPEVADALGGVCSQVASGATAEDAYRELGEFQQEIQKAQKHLRQTEQSLVDELRNQLTREQREALITFHSPVRHLAGIVQAMKRVRQAPEAWQHVRPQAVQGLMRFASQPGGSTVTAQELGEWLDVVHTMSAEEFAEAEPTLAKEWAKALAPEAMKRVNDPRNQEQRLRETCQRLLTHPAGLEVVRAVLEAAMARPGE